MNLKKLFRRMIMMLLNGLWMKLWLEKDDDCCEYVYLVRKIERIRGDFKNVIKGYIMGK